MLDALVAEQRRLGLSDQAFSETLGCRKWTWYSARHGRRPLSAQIVRRAILVYPHLMQEGLFFLVSGNTQSKESQLKVKPPSNIDLPATEKRGELVLTADRQTLACRGTYENAAPRQGGGARVISSPLVTGKVYDESLTPASEQASQAVDVGRAG